MKKPVIFAFFLLSFFILTSSVEAHPGRTAADGCHYCRTNCDAHGVSWNERHCHNGGSAPAQSVPVVEQKTSTQIQPTTYFKDLFTPTPKPTKQPTPISYIETEMDKKKMFKVIKVIDGDTIEVNIRGKSEKVRLLAIDTPETVDPRKPVQCFGKEATRKMQSLVSDKYVRLIDDKSQGNRDKYQRLLRYVYDGQIFINAEMVKQGYAFSYKKYPTTYLNDFNNLEKQAKEKNLGLWNSCKQ